MGLFLRPDSADLSMPDRGVIYIEYGIVLFDQQTDGVHAKYP